MNYLKARLIKTLYDFFESDLRRINHALEVMRHAEQIMTDYDEADRELVLAAALLHDVGIKPSEAELGYNDGQTQERYGPPIARQLLEQINFAPDKIERACQIIGNHHSPSRYPYVELKILKAADRIVNRGEASTAEGV